MDEAERLSTLRARCEVYHGHGRLTGLAGARCLLCGAACEATGALLCAGCRGDLPWRSNPWLPRPPPPLSGALAACMFGYPIDQLVRRAKRDGDLAALALCGTLLRSKVSGHLPAIDLVVPVPLARGRQLRRGYNQALELARPLAAALDAPLGATAARRTRPVPSQRGLGLAARRRNVAGSFAVGARLDGMTVLVVDDVITTGATVAHLARALRAAGAQCVIAAAVAATPPTHGVPATA